MSTTKDKAKIQEYTEKLILMTNGFCDRYLDEEYKALCEKLIRKMSRKRVVPFLSGKLEIWAAAVIYALGQINFLFDKSFKPYSTPDEICSYFGTSKSTTSGKAKIIRDMFSMNYYDREFSTKEMKKNDPFAQVLVDGVPVPVMFLPPELQKLVREHPDTPMAFWTVEKSEE